MHINSLREASAALLDVTSKEFEFPISSNGFESSLTPGKINKVSSIFENKRK